MKNFKRVNALFLALMVVFVSLFSSFSVSAAKEKRITVKIAGKKLSAKKKSYKVSKGYLLPAKLAAKAMGAKKITYNKKKKTVTIKKGKTTLVYKINTKKVTVNKKNKKTAVKTVIRNKVPYVDGKNLAKNLGYTKLSYNKKKKVLTINKPKKDTVVTPVPTQDGQVPVTSTPVVNPTSTPVATSGATATPVAVKTPNPVSITMVDPLEFAEPVVDTTGVGYNIKRTMYKLREGLPVTIALYGQSITSQDNKWTLALKEYLEKSYPQSDITWVNMAVGGWGVSILKDCVEYDFREVYPDLTILYVYGDSNLYDGIVKTIRSQTNSEVMMINEHKAGSESYEGSHIPANGMEYGTYWSDAMSYILLPAIAEKYNCELADIRTYWVKYLTDNGKTKAYTSLNNNNDIHLNAKGQSLMFHILKQYFVDVGYNGLDAELSNERTLKFGTDYSWNNGTITIPFTGNRVEVIADAVKNGTATVKIDGKSPSEYKELYYNTRVTPNQDYYWGSLGTLRKRSFYGFEFAAVPTLQEITMTTQNSSSTALGLSITGSKSGDMGSFASTITMDGSGIISAGSPATFTFDNGAIVGHYTDFRFQDSLTNGLQIKTTIKLNGMDNITTSNVGNYILASGLENTEHTLTITANDVNNLPAIDKIVVKTPRYGTNALVTPTTRPMPSGNAIEQFNALAANHKRTYTATNHAIGFGQSVWNESKGGIYVEDEHYNHENFKASTYTDAFKNGLKNYVYFLVKADTAGKTLQLEASTFVEGNNANDENKATAKSTAVSTGDWQLICIEITPHETATESLIQFKGSWGAGATFTIKGMAVTTVNYV